MTKCYRFGGLLAALLLSASVYADNILVEGAWSRATAPGQDSGMVDMAITSQHQATLVRVSSPVVKTAELHSMTHDSGVMKMREVKSIELPAGKKVNLGESGYHVMLIGLKAPLKAGDSVPLTLSIKVGKAVVMVDAHAEVRPLTETTTAEQQHEHHHH